MKITTSIAASLLACVALARPRTMAEGDPLPQTSRITAFVVSENGEPSVECWEITHMVETQQAQRADGSKATAYALPLATSSELDGLDVLTWPAYSPIWPIPNDAVRAEWFDLSDHLSLFSVQNGLISINAAARIDSNADDDDEDDHHIFSLENGDDWFYFEDNYSGSELARSASAAAAPFIISTVSASETEVLRLKFNQPPKHKVLHKGGCSFTGIETPAEDTMSSDGAARVHSPLTVQVRIEDL